MVQLNEAIDQALVESIMTYSKQTDHAREVFLAVLGHDSKAPLAGLDMAGSALANNIPPKDIEEIRKRVTRNVELMKIMVGDLVEFNKTKLGSGIPVNRNEADIKDIANTALANAEAVQPNYKHDLHT